MIVRSLALWALFVVCASHAAAQSYQYDERGRLIRASYSDCSTIRYFYDAAGNRTERIVLAGDGSCAGNQPPVAANDTIVLAPGATGLFDLLAAQGSGSADADPNGDPIRIISVSQGSVPVASSGALGVQLQDDRRQVRITAPGVNGSYGFSYRIEDAFGLTDEAQVQLTVQTGGDPDPNPNPNPDPDPGPDPDPDPEPTPGDFATGDTGFMVVGETKSFDVLANDAGTGLTVVSVERVSGNSAASVVNNRVRIIANGSYPTSGAYPAEVYSYTVENASGQQDTAELTLTVNRKPVLAYPLPPSIEMAPGEELDLTLADLGASDPDGDPLQFENVYTLFLAFDRAEISQDGRTIHLKAPSSTGQAILNCRITDGRWGTVNCGMNINVVAAPTNTCPVARNDSYTIPSGGSSSFSVLSNDEDTDAGESLSLVSVGAVSGGGSVSKSGDQVYFQAPTGPATSTFTYTMTDGECQRDATVTVTTNAPANRAPVAVNDSYTVASGSTTYLSVLSNDSDPDGDSISLASVSGASGGGSASRSGNQARFTAPTGPGNSSFSYTITDVHGAPATATVTVTVNAPVNTAPTPGTVSLAGLTQGLEMWVGIPLSGIDPDGDTVTLQGVSSGSRGGSAQLLGGSRPDVIRVWSSAAKGQWEDFTYTVSDGVNPPVSATLRVRVDNYAPTPVGNSYTFQPGETRTLTDITANDSDPDGDPLTIGRVDDFSAGGSGSVVNNGTAVQYTAPTTQGSARFGAVIQDPKGGYAFQWVDITVTSPNQNPVTQPDYFSVPAGETVILNSILSNDSDPDGDPLTIERVYEFQGGGSGYVNPDLTSVTYTAPLWQGSARFAYVALDGRGGYRFNWVNITVTPPIGVCGDVFCLPEP